jgi:6-phosphofructokinase 1
MAKKIGILTAGSDAPGLNATIRGFGKALQGYYGMGLIGFRDGFQGLLQNKVVDLGGNALSNILTAGGTVLGTSRDVPYAIEEDGNLVDKTDLAVEVYQENKLDALVCIGGQETQKAALRLAEAGLNILTLPKSAHNDVPKTDVTIGFDTARMIATEAIDRLHSTANSNHRIIIVEIMGREVGWLTLGAGLASGSDVILLPEIPYSIEKISEAILDRSKAGKRFSIIAVAEGAHSAELVAFFERSLKLDRKNQAEGEEGLNSKKERLMALRKQYSGQTLLLANQLEEITGIESRITILGYLLRGGTPSSGDRILATCLGTEAAESVAAGEFGKMIASAGGQAVRVDLAEVVGQDKPVPMDHPWITSARLVGTKFGD